jgi:hypothetical protein
MTIKVLERREYIPPVFQVKCSRCTSLLEYQKEDIKASSDQRDQRTFYSVACPVCKVSISVSTNPYQ